MKIRTFAVSGILALGFSSCQPTGTAASGVLRTTDHAVHGVGRTARTAGTGVVRTVGNTASTAGEGIAEGDLKKSTVGTVKAAGQGTGATAVATGRSHVKTSSGVLKDTGKTLNDTGEAMKDE